MDINNFLRVYKNLANNFAREEEILDLYWNLQDRIMNVPDFICKSHNKSHDVKRKFSEKVPDMITASIAIDAVAHSLHQGGDEVLQKIFPYSDYTEVKNTLDNLAGNDLKSPIRQYNRDYFTNFLSKDTGLLQLEKQDKQVGRTTRDDISLALEEYKKLFDAGLASKAEILTLARFYPEEEKYYTSVIKLNLLETEPMVVGGPASIEMVDREGHLITVEALDDAFRKFMSNPRLRNSQIIHCLAPGNKVYKNGGRSGKGGYVNIEDIKEGDTVLTHAGVFRKVKKTMSHNNLDDYLIVLTLENKEKVKVTPEHKILTNMGWVEAKDLTLDSILMTPEFPGTSKKGDVNWPNGHPNDKIETVISNGISIISIDKEPYTGIVYNLEIEEYQSFAGEGIIYHNSDVQIGWILPAYISKNGSVFKSGVDDKQLWVICEIRDDVKVGQRVIDEINKGTIRSYSIAGSGTDIVEIEKNGTMIKQVNSLEILEVSLCEKPANPGAIFDILKSVSNEIKSFDINALIDKIADLSIFIPGFYIYLEESESPRLIIKVERTNTLIEDIISELNKITDNKIQVVNLSKELLSGEEIPLFKIKLEPIGFEEEIKNYVDVSEITHDNNVFEQKQESFLNGLLKKIKGE